VNYFTADYHFNHPNIIDFCGRPYKDCDHMNEGTIGRHNERVRKRDTVFHIGDFCFGGTQYANEFLDRLNGNIILLRGNHDRRNGVRTSIESIHIKTFGMNVLLTHRPEDAYMVRELYDFCLVGHIHEKWRFQYKMCNVGIDVWDYPVHMKQILKAYKNEYKRELRAWEERREGSK